MNSTQPLALIVLNYNSYDDTCRCVDSIIAFGEDFHIVIVDNASPDGSGGRLKDHYSDITQVSVLMSEHNGGYGAGNNIGIQYAENHLSCDKVAILNPDVVIPSAGVLWAMICVLEDHPDIGIVGATIMNRDGSFNLNYSAWNLAPVGGFVEKQSLRTKRYDRPFSGYDYAPGIARIDCVAGCFFMARLSCMKKIGYFDENIFLYNEEDVIGIKCKAAGFHTVLLLDQYYYHDHREPDKRSLTFREKIGATSASYESARYVCRTYYGGSGLLRLALIEAVNRIILALSYIKGRLT